MPYQALFEPLPAGVGLTLLMWPISGVAHPPGYHVLPVRIHPLRW